MRQGFPRQCGRRKLKRGGCWEVLDSDSDRAIWMLTPKSKSDDRKQRRYLGPIRVREYCCHSVTADVNNGPASASPSLRALLLLPRRKLI